MLLNVTWTTRKEEFGATSKGGYPQASWGSQLVLGKSGSVFPSDVAFAPLFCSLF